VFIDDLRQLAFERNAVAIFLNTIIRELLRPPLVFFEPTSSIVEQSCHPHLSERIIRFGGLSEEVLSRRNVDLSGGAKIEADGLLKDTFARRYDGTLG
jgi:hypothetical protein